MDNKMSDYETVSAPFHDKINKVLITIMMLALVLCFGAMIYSTVLTFEKSTPIPEKFVTKSGNIVMTHKTIVSGKDSFQKSDMMDYGSIYGMGSYFGEDYTAEYLVKLGKTVSNEIALEKYNIPFSDLTYGPRADVSHIMKKQLKSINLTEKTVVLPDSVAKAIFKIRKTIAANLQKNNNKIGWTKAYSMTNTEAKMTGDFLLYSSITTIAHRPNKNYSWTNNWPYEPSVGNTPTTDTFVWTWISLAILIFFIGGTLAIFKLYIDKDDPGEQIINAPLSKFFKLTPSQKATGKYFILVALLLLIQIGAGVIMAHYYYDRSNFYGINPIPFLPFAFLRTIHLLTPILWIGLSWIASSLFLAPFIGGGIGEGHEPKCQKFLVDFLFYVTLLIIAGTVLGNYLGIMGFINKGWFWFGSQGLSYLELGRFWQILLFVGFVLWSILLLRSLLPALKKVVHARQSFYSYCHIEYLVWYSSIAIAVIFIFGMVPLTHSAESFTLTDFWRWWVVHLWVEWAFELFASAILGYFLMSVGLVSRQLAERAVIFEWTLIIISGVLGTGHHYYWVGEPDIWIGLGSTFSFLEILPLFLLILESTQQYLKMRTQGNFKYKLSFLYILGSAFWNFVGAGVFGGGTTNPPILNYYEHATFLTLNHAHAALFGAFGLLALGLVYLVLRCMAGNDYEWSDKPGIWAFWLYNAGLILWIVLNFFPIGWPQLAAVYDHGLAYARSMAFYDTTTVWQWLRFPGDVVFAAGAVVMSVDFVRKVMFKKRQSA